MSDSTAGGSDNTITSENPPNSTTAQQPPPSSTTNNPPPTSQTPPPSSSSSTQSPPSSSTPTNPPPQTQPTPTSKDDDPPTPTPTNQSPTDPGSPPDVQTSTTTIIQTMTQAPPNNPGVTSPTLSSGTSTSTNPAISSTNTPSGGLSSGGKIAVAVVVPIAAVALLVLAGIFLWRKRKQRKDAEEQRRKEVEEYGYNPNADPTVPNIGGAGAYEMREDDTAGYRGWGSTGHTARKPSTTLSGGPGPVLSSSPPTHVAAAPISADSRSGEPLMSDMHPSPEGEILGAMGPAASGNRNGGGVGVHRGPSNASSSYSAAGRSDGSGDGPIGVAYGGPGTYYDQYGGNPYMDGGYGGSAGMMPQQQQQQQPGAPGGPPVIRDVTARRNTRIESLPHYPQQTAGISQNF